MNVNTTFQRLFVALGLLLLFSGCASVSYQTSGKVQKGRMALLYGDPNAALKNFQRFFSMTHRIQLKRRSILSTPKPSN